MKVDYNFIDDKYINIESLVDIDEMFSNNDEVDSGLVKHFVSEYISMIRSTYMYLKDGLIESENILMDNDVLDAKQFDDVIIGIDSIKIDIPKDNEIFLLHLQNANVFYKIKDNKLYINICNRRPIFKIFKRSKSSVSVPFYDIRNIIYKDSFNSDLYKDTIFNYMLRVIDNKELCLMKYKSKINNKVLLLELAESNDSISVYNNIKTSYIAITDKLYTSLSRINVDVDQIGEILDSIEFKNHDIFKYDGSTRVNNI